MRIQTINGVTVRAEVTTAARATLDAFDAVEAAQAWIARQRAACAEESARAAAATLDTLDARDDEYSDVSEDAPTLPRIRIGGGA